MPTRISSVLMFFLVGHFCLTAVAQEAQKNIGEELTLQLLEKGAAPHRALRFEPKPGEKSWLVVEITVTQNRKAPGRNLPKVDVPGQQLLVDIETKKVASNGDIDYLLTYKDAKLIAETKTPAIIAREDAFKKIVGSSVTGTMSNRGILKKSDTKKSESANTLQSKLSEDLKESISNACSALPEEAVGVGAKWKVVQKLNINGIESNQIVSSTLTELTSSGFTVESSIEQTASAQEMKDRMIPAGSSLRLEALAGVGKAKCEFSFNNIFPRNGSYSMNLTSTLKAVAAGKSEEMTVEQQSEIRMKESGN